MRPYQEILPMLTEVLGTLEEEPLRAEVCGAIRRELDEVDEVEIAVLGSVQRAYRLIHRNDALEMRLTRWLPKGGVVRRVDMLINDIPFKLYRAESEYWGAMVLYLTGNRYFNIAMRGRARSLVMKLNQYGLWFNGERIGGVTEEQLFDALDVPHVAPKDRSFDVRTELGGLIYTCTKWSEDEEVDD